MKAINRRQAMSILATIPFLPYSSTLPLYGENLSGQKTTGNVDWSKELCDSEMQRIPDPRKLGKWGYAISLYLYGQFLVYKRTAEKKYLDYIQDSLSHFKHFFLFRGVQRGYFSFSVG